MTSTGLCARFCLLLLGGVFASGCAAMKPVYYQGDATRWSIPMVRPLENEAVVVPVLVHGHGPYLFLLDPNAPESAIDASLAAELDLYPGINSVVMSDDDKRKDMSAYEVQNMTIGELSVRNITIRGIKPGVLNFRGQRLYGYIGADLLTRTIVIDVDRDRGVVTLALTGSERLPPGSNPVTFNYAWDAYLVPVTINGKEFELAIDLVASVSALWPLLLDRAGVASESTQASYVDETGTVQHVDHQAFADVAFKNGLRFPHARLLHFADQRTRENNINGILGQNLLAQHRIVLDRDKRILYFAERRSIDSSVGERIARWGTTYANCTDLGCIKILYVAAKTESSEPPVGGRLVAIRTGKQQPAQETLIQALDQVGVPIETALIRLSLAADLAQVTLPLPAGFGLERAVSFRVVDISPFPTACAQKACVEAVHTNGIHTGPSQSVAGH